MNPTRTSNPIYVALDAPDLEYALSLSARVAPHVGGLKLGMEFLAANGPQGIREFEKFGLPIFADTKFHDIPNTVAGAVQSAVATGAWMVNVHASGGLPMMRAAARAGAEAAARLGRPVPLIIGVTVLTSMDDTTLRTTGVERPLVDQVRELAQLAQRAGLDGVVASPQETAVIRAACGAGFAIVTPSIRGAAAGTEKNDQSRTMGPAEAVKAGASYIVVGRPIIAAPEPRAAAEAIVAELRAG